MTEYFYRIQITFKQINLTHLKAVQKVLSLNQKEDP